MEINDIKFDYYSLIFTYIKLIMESLNKTTIEGLVVREIFNVFFNRMDSNEIEEMVIYSSLFENRINKMNNQEKNDLLNNLYEFYIKNIMINYTNRDMDAVIYFYDELNNKIKSISGYYELHNEDEYFDNMSNTKVISK